MEPAPIEFFFDFSSPYSYLASEWIGPLAARHGRALRWRPILLGAVFKASGGQPLSEVPLKGPYSVHDFARSARFAGVPYVHPQPFPIATVAAARGLLWVQQAAPARDTEYVHAVFRAYFAQGRNIGEPAVLAEVLGAAGFDPAALAAGIQQPSIKDALKAQVDEAVQRGVFGGPFIVVDGEPFWGNDRRPQVERWLASGPF